MLDADLADAAARAAYYAAFYAAQTLIFDRTGKVTKTHKSVNVEFSRLMAGATWPDLKLRGLLSRFFQYKQTADYGTDAAVYLPNETAMIAIQDARHFVHFISQIMED